MNDQIELQEDEYDLLDYVAAGELSPDDALDLLLGQNDESSTRYAEAEGDVVDEADQNPEKKPSRLRRYAKYGAAAAGGAALTAGALKRKELGDVAAKAGRFVRLKGAQASHKAGEAVQRVRDNVNARRLGRAWS